ncbi:hypothetical protein [Microbacterium sp. NPDC056569]|uniref:hypothetical protein n=1 Tax=Microbacterium sp. NPDC056569 TaxID=3345867 RepID=UPI00366C2FB5
MREAGVGGSSAWRANDVVAYEVMRESATTLTALLLGSSDDDRSAVVEVAAEVRQLRSSVLAVDSYDRDAVSTLADRIRDRIKELTESKP